MASDRFSIPVTLPRPEERHMPRNPDELRSLADECRLVASYCLKNSAKANLQGVAIFFEKEADQRDSHERSKGTRPISFTQAAAPSNEQL